MYFLRKMSITNKKMPGNIEKIQIPISTGSYSPFPITSIFQSHGCYKYDKYAQTNMDGRR